MVLVLVDFSHKMKKVYVSILERPPPNLYKFKIASTMKGSNFKDYIAREIVDLTDIDFFFIITDKDQNQSFLDESKPFSTVTEQKKLKLRLVVTNQNITLRTSISDVKTVVFNTKQSVSENISSLNLDPHHQYALAFRPKGSFCSRICARNTQLVFQGWKGEPITLHRIASRHESVDRSPQNMQNLYQICRLYLMDGILYLKKEHWGESLGYLYLSEGKTIQTFKKHSLQKMLPDSIPSNEQMYQQAKKIITQNSFLTPEEASHRFVDYFFQYGALCAHIEEVKFLLKDKKWRMAANRCIYVSPQKLLVTKNYNDDIVQSEAITNIVSTDNDKESVILTMSNGKQWILKSDNPPILRQIIEDAKQIGVLINPKHYRLSSQWDPQESPDVSSINSREITQEPENLTQNPEKSTENPENHVFFERRIPPIPKPPKILSNVSSTSSASSISKVPLSPLTSEKENDESEDFIEEKGVALRTRRLSEQTKEVPGISEIVMPDSEEENAPYSIADQYYRNLKIVGNLDFPHTEEIDAIHNDVPDLSKIVSGDENNSFADQTNKKIMFFTILLCLLLFLLIKSL